MPPAISDDEESIVGFGTKSPAKSAMNHKTVTRSESVEAPVMDVESAEEEEEEEDSDEDLDENEYVVEEIISHLIGEDSILRFEVKWEGYEKKSDRTWEPEQNLKDSASKILQAYYSKMGGREAIMDEFDNPPPPKPAPKKRGRAPAVKSEPSANGKRQKSSHPKDTSPPASTDASWSGPPSGSWEDHVQGIDACEGADGNIMVFLSWKGGKKSQHSLSQVYKKCPQKMLKFYESHLSLSSSTESVDMSANVVVASSKRPRGRPKKSN